jgi:phage minor structural protein
MITIYGRYQTAFVHNGFGILEVYEDVVEEELNGIFKLTFKYPKSSRLADKVVNGATLRADTPEGKEPFRIWSVVDRDDVLEVTAYHITFDLGFKFIEDKNLVNLGAQSALGRLLEDTAYTAVSDVPFVASARVVRKSVQQAIFSDDENSFLNRWGGEFKRTGMTLNAMNHRGRTFAQNPVAIRYGKNLVSYESTEDESTYFNRVMPIGFDGLLLPEKYVDRTGIDLNDIRVTTVEYSDIKVIKDPADPKEDEVTAEVAYQMMRERVAAEFLDGKYDPKVNHRITFADLSKTTEYENRAVLVTRYMGDDVKIINQDGVDVTARIISYRYCPTTKEYMSMELGNFQEKPMNIMAKVDLINRVVTELSEQQITEERVTTLLTSALGGYVKELNGEMFIMDTEDPLTAQKVWRWNINGLGYSSTGINGPYGIAITMDGTIVGTFIQAKSISTNEISNEASIRLVANTTVEINENGLMIDDGVSPTIARHTGNESTYIDRVTGNPFASYAAGQADVDVLNARKVYSPHVANKLAEDITVYVASTPTGDGSGRDASNKASDVDTALKTALDGANVVNGLLTIDIAGKVTDDFHIDGLVGSGRILVKGSTGQITGQIAILNCGIRVDIQDLDVARPSVTATAALISAINSMDVRLDGCRLDGYSVGTGIGAYYGGGIYATDCDIVKCEYAYDASVNARIAQVGCRGANNLYVGNSALGSNIVLSGTRPVATNIKREKAGGVITDASSTAQTSTFAATPATWKTVSKTFAGKLSTANHSTGYVWKTGTWTQGTWEGKPQRGYADFGSSIKDWLNSAGGYQNISSVIIKANRNTISGGGSVSLKIASPSAQSLPAVARGSTAQASLVSGLVTAMTSGALKLSSSTTATADYAGFDKIEIIVTAEKKA